MQRVALFFTTVAISLGAVTISPATAATWHVPGDAATIKGGIGLASAGDTVLVACGTYNESRIRMKSGVSLRSATGARNCVTIDAQQADRVFLIRAIDSTAQIVGFTITGGYIDGTDTNNGGGIYCEDGSSLSIINCTIMGNFASSDGGGVACAFSSSPTFINCFINDNEAGNGGAGMRISEGSSPTLTDVRILNNLGTGIWITNASAELVDCNVRSNSNSGISLSGGFTSGTTITLTGCNIMVNSASRGGGLRLWGATATLTNCTISGNDANDGGGIHCLGASATLTDCKMFGNSAELGGAVYLDEYQFQQLTPSFVTVDHSPITGNTATQNGPSGFVEAGNELLLICSVNDLSGFAGGGTITMDNPGCFVAVENATWGRIKALYR